MEKVAHLNMRMRTDFIPIKFTISGSGKEMLPYYEGPYVVDPRKVSQELETEQTSMHEDVVVNSIFYSEVLNPQGGNTVTIGLE